MNTRFLHTCALFGCSLFLGGNIVFDLYDTPQHPADYRIFYIPFSVMVFTLVVLARDYAKKEGKVILIFWNFFLWMSIAQIVKFVGFNPFIKMISDYLFLTVASIGTIIKLWRLKSEK